MTKRWISDKRQRRSKKYLEIHAQLAKEVRDGKRPAPDKHARKQARSDQYRLTGAE